MSFLRLPWAPRTGASSRLPRRSMAGLGLALGVLVGASCNLDVQSVFTCLTNEDCIAEGGEGGVCEPNNLCTFPDASCDLGKRWHDRASDLAGKCYMPSDIGGATDSAAGSGTASNESTDGGESTTGGATTLPSDDTADGSSSGTPPATDDGGSSSGGLGAACDDLFGTAPSYMLCEETADGCSFNVMLEMTSCDALCMSFGSTCIEAFTNPETGCTTDGALPCDDATTNESVCRCAKP